MIHTSESIAGIVVEARFTLSLLSKALQGDQEPGLDPNITLSYDEAEGVRLMIAEVQRALGEVLEWSVAYERPEPKMAGGPHRPSSESRSTATTGRLRAPFFVHNRIPQSVSEGLRPMPLDDADKLIEERILASPAPGKHAARSALHHLDRAQHLIDIDPEMAAFRAITGEEESATAVFHALVRRRYPGAARINRTNHKHKAALAPFLAALAPIHQGLVEEGLEPTVVIPELGKNDQRVHVRLTIPTPAGPMWATPVPPLEYFVSRNGALVEISDELDQVASACNAADIDAHIRWLANRRNQLLYASDQGVPSLERESLPGFIEGRRRAVRWNLVLYLLIDEYAEHQAFVVHALDQYLKLLRLIPEP